MLFARFWVWDSARDAYVQLRLNDSIHTEESPLVLNNSGGPTDEGHNHSTECYWLEGDLVHSLQVSRGADCDGRYEHVAHHVCCVYELECGQFGTETDEDGEQVVVEGIRLPKWQAKDRHQRDYNAEAAGY